MRTNHDMRGLLQNQALAIDQFQSRWQMAGQEAHAFVARTRSESEDLVRTELGAIERFEVTEQYARTTWSPLSLPWQRHEIAAKYVTMMWCELTLRALDRM